MFSQIPVARSRHFFKKVTKNFVINKTCSLTAIFGGVLKSMLTLNEAIIDVKEG